MTDAATFYTVVICATDDNAPTARPLCLQWVKTQQPHTPQTAAEMLPVGLSPTGKKPASHWLCCMQLSKAQYEHMAGFIEANNVPVRMTVVGPQEDGHQHKLPNRDAWLQANGLAVVR
jgi:hypothetical protein